MHAPLHDVAAAIVIVGIVVGVIRVVPVVTDEAAGEEVPMVAEAMVEPAMSHVTEAGAGEAVTLDGADRNIVCRRMRETIAEVSAADGSRAEAASAKAAAAAAAAAPAAASSAAVATTAAATAMASQGHVRRQHGD